LAFAARRLAWLTGALVWTAAAAVGAIVAVLLAAAVVTTAFFASACLALMGAMIKARGALRHSADPTLIEARNVGGHSWVAYGWDGRG
jgi:hypothetical protein